MLDESQHPSRQLRDEEKAVLAALLGTRIEIFNQRLKSCAVEDMADGGMGSIRFLQGPDESCAFDKAVAEAEYVDADGVLVSIALNIDQRGNLFELDFWKVDFSPLREYPRPELLIVKRVYSGDAQTSDKKSPADTKGTPPGGPNGEDPND